MGFFGAAFTVFFDDGFELLFAVGFEDFGVEDFAAGLVPFFDGAVEAVEAFGGGFVAAAVISASTRFSMAPRSTL